LSFPFDSYYSFLIVVLSHCARAEALRRRPRCSNACTIIFPWLREGHPLLRRKRKHRFIVVCSLLSFLGCTGAEALRKRGRFRCADAEALKARALSQCLSVMLVSLLLHAHTERRKKVPGGVAVTSWHACQNLHAGACGRWRLSRPRKHSFHAESFFFGGGLVEDHNVGGTICLCST